MKRLVDQFKELTGEEIAVAEEEGKISFPVETVEKFNRMQDIAWQNGHSLRV